MMDRLNDVFKLDRFDYEPLEITLTTPDSFLKIRETLTRIGILSKKSNVLWQSCHILSKRGKFYLVHFKELFALSNKKTDLTDNDIERRNRIAKLLEDWRLLKVVTVSQLYYMCPSNEISIISYKDKSKYELKTKYCMVTEFNERKKAQLGE
jgi:hypothetical protein